jgi:hypothetical protein
MSQQAFAKRKKEMERKRKAQEKMEKRQNKKNPDEESNGFQETEA